MKAPISRSSAALLIAGMLAVLLLGAFSRFDAGVTPPASNPAQIQADAAIETAGEPELPAGLSPGLAEIIRMAQSHVDENVILDFIHNSGRAYAPTADEILYLSDLGLSQTIIAALFPQKSAASPEVAADNPAPAPPVSPVAPLTELGATGGVFHNALAPYGSWVQVPDYGLCWQPATETVNPDWRPYVDQGQWLYTDNGWYWQSGYSWGWAAFHYGRWTKTGRLGWVWVPGNVWGPAWVSWRIALNYSGWAPLPPGVGIAAGGLTFDNHHVTADSGFGLPAGWFTFVGEANLLSRNPANYAVEPGQAAAIYGRSMGVNNYYMANQKIINLGPGRPRVAAPAENESAALLTGKIPARQIEPLVEPKPQPENDSQSFSTGELASAAFVDTIPGQGTEILVPSAAQPVKTRHHHQSWPEEFPAYSERTAPPRRLPPADHELTRPDQVREPFNETPMREPSRIEAPLAPYGSKSGK